MTAGARVPGSGSAEKNKTGDDLANVEMSSFDGGNEDDVEEHKGASELLPG